jgi:hypothetical protein
MFDNLKASAYQSLKTSSTNLLHKKKEVIVTTCDSFVKNKKEK